MLTLNELERRAYIKNDQATLRGIAAGQAEVHARLEAEHEAELERLRETIAQYETKLAENEEAIATASAAAAELIEALKELQ